ncbi:MAG: yajC [Clostridiales bacterium]|jgi:preprotein translocase subunit YajC|nr:yajC [Clostridiales bacterium]
MATFLTGEGSQNWYSLILLWGGMIALMYFLLIRPQKKRQKAEANMRSAIKTGDWILTSGGIYGEVVDVLKEVLIVEFGNNKACRFTLHKDAILSVKAPDMTINTIE